jgi:hypothetical protein
MSEPAGKTLSILGDARLVSIATKRTVQVIGEVWAGEGDARHMYLITAGWEEGQGHAPGERVQRLEISGARANPAEMFTLESVLTDGASFCVAGPATIYALARVLEELAIEVENDLRNREADRDAGEEDRTKRGTTAGT